jgi:hypothetical protein
MEMPLYYSTFVYHIIVLILDTCIGTRRYHSWCPPSLTRNFCAPFVTGMRGRAKKTWHLRSGLEVTVGGGGVGVRTPGGGAQNAGAGCGGPMVER